MSVTTITYKDGAGVTKTANAGSDGTNTTTGITIFDSSGAYIGTLPVSVASLPALTAGSAVIGAVTQSGTWTAATNADGTIGAGTAPAKALVGGLVYNSSPITLTTGQASAIQADTNGYLKVNVAASITQPVSIASLPALTTGAAVIGAVTQSGTWNVGTVTTLPALVAGSATIGGVKLIDTAGTNVAAISASNALKVDGSAVTNPVSLASLPALTTGAAVIGAVTQSGTWTAATNADGTIGAGTAPSKAHTAGLIYNSSPITLTTTQGSALQGDASGFLKVNIASPATLPVSIASLPALTTGAAVIGAVTQSGTWTAATNADGTIGAGTAPAKALVGGVVYNSSPITLTTGQASATQADVNGYLKVNVAASITQPVSLSALPALTTGAAVIGAVTQSGTWTTATNADGTIAAGTAPAKALTAGLIYNSSPITMTTGQGAALQSDVNGYLKVALVSAASGVTQTVGGTTVIISGTFTRAANATAYAVGDMMTDSANAPITFANTARVSAGSGTVLGGRLIYNSAVTTNASFRLWLFGATPGTQTDNAAMVMTYAQRDLRLGYIDFTTPIAGSDCCEFIGYPGQGMPIGFKLTGTSMFGIIQTLAAYTPVSGELFDCNLQIAQD